MPDLDLAHRGIDAGLRREENVRLKPYLDTTGTPTIGIGCTTYLDGRPVRITDPPITAEQCNRMQAVNIDRYMHDVVEMVHGECTTNQLIALVICAYNIGLQAMRGSTMIRQHIAGNYVAAARAFGLWNKSHSGPGRSLVDDPVLTGRRAREAAIYITDDHPEQTGRMPQAVGGETSLARSPINLGGAATIGGGVLTGLGSLTADDGGLTGKLGALTGVVDAGKAAVASLSGILGGMKPITLLAIVLVVAGWQIVRWRRQQRRDGWA